MAETTGMTGNENHNDASSMERINTCDNDDVAPWSDLNDDVLLLVMMQLGAVELFAFGGVCKSWRSRALSNRNRFIVSRPPMSISISGDVNANDNENECCYLEDLDGRKFKTIIPHSTNRTCVGVTRGYLILYGEKTRDFWLVNLITRHQLHIRFPFADVGFCSMFRGATLVFSPSISRWVFVLFNRRFTCNKVWFCIVGKREWTYVITRYPILDLLAIKGKIYVLYTHNRLGEVILFPTPQVTLLEIKNFPKQSFNRPGLVASGENLYVVDLSSEYPYNIQEINLCKMEWVPREDLGEEYSFFFSCGPHRGGTVVTQAQLWDDLYSQYGRYALCDKSGKGRFFHAKMWYFFHDCLNVNLLHE